MICSEPRYRGVPNVGGGILLKENLKSIFNDDVNFGDWEAIADIFNQVINNNDHIKNLLMSSCEAVYGNFENLNAALSAINCFQISIILVDDMLDEDPRGDYLKIGHAHAANQALAFQATGYRFINNSDYLEKQKSQMVKIASDMMFETSFGQLLDTKIPDTENSYWEMVRAKSSPFYSSLFQIGAIMGNVSTKDLSEIKSFGDIYGEMIQIQDDLDDSFANPANPDWIQGKMPLPILFALIVDHPDRKEFLDLRENIEAKDNLLKAQKILLKCGAVSYCIELLYSKNKLAEKIISANNQFNQVVLRGILDRVMDAPKTLIENITRGKV